MNQILVKQSLMKLEDAFSDLTSEKLSRQVSIAKTKIEEAKFWLKDALETEQVFE